MLGAILPQGDSFTETFTPTLCLSFPDFSELICATIKVFFLFSDADRTPFIMCLPSLLLSQMRPQSLYLVLHWEGDSWFSASSQ